MYYFYAASGQASNAGKTSEADAQVCRNADGSFIRGNPEAFCGQMQAQGWQMMSTEGKDFDIIMQKGDLQFAVKWGSGDSKGAEMFLHGDGEQLIKNDKSQNPFENCSSDSDIIVIQNSAQKKNGTRSQSWEKLAGEIYEAARLFLEQGYDLGISGYSAGGYGAYVMTEYVMGLQGKNGTVPLQEGQHFTARFFDGLGSTKRMPAMLASSPNNFTAEFYNSNDRGFEISRGTLNVGRKLSKQFGNVRTASYEFGSHNVHNNRSYCRHGMLEFTVPEVIPGCTKTE